MNHLRTLLLLPLLLLAAGTTAHAAKLVIMIGEDEYHTWETLPAFATSDLEPQGHKVTIIHADKADKNSFPGIEAALRDADLLLVSVRRRTPPREQLDAVRAFVAGGKPVIGIRTASHAFALRPKDKVADARLEVWQEFDAEVLGGNYTNHHRGEDKTIVTAAPGAEAHAILAARRHQVRIDLSGIVEYREANVGEDRRRDFSASVVESRAFDDRRGSVGRNGRKFTDGETA